MATKPLPEGVVWDAPPQPVPPKQGQRQGGVIITDPTVQSREQRADSAESRAEATTAQSLQKGELDIQAKQLELQQKQWETQNRELEVKLGKEAGFYLRALRAGEEFEKLGVGPEGQFRATVGGVVPDNWLNALTPEKRQAAEAYMRNFAMASLRYESGAAIPPEEIQSQIRTFFPVAGDKEATLKAKAQMRRDLIESLKLGAGPRAAQEIDAYIAEQGSVFDQTDTGGKPTVSGEGDTYATPEDMAHRDRLQQAWAAGATPEDIFRMVEEDGYRVTPEMRSALEGREPGSPVNFSVPESGTRDDVDKLVGKTADSEVGAYTILAANALLSGSMDELGPVLGLDAEQIETAKQMLREKYPKSAFVGEVSGQAMQMAGAAKGLSVLGTGAKTAGLISEVGGGAAYGAGESNDNRALGAGIGGVAGLIGNRIGAKLATPEAKSAIDKVAEESGVPAEEITRLLQGMSEKADTPPVSPAAQEEVAALAKSATGIGPMASSARKKLAQMAKTDPEAAAAAERLGVELPIDILSDNAQVQSLAGLARSQVGSEAETQWLNTSARVAEQARVALADLGATDDLAQVSDDVLARLNSSMEALETQGATLRREVDEAINIRDRVEANGTRSAVFEVIDDMGGGAEGRAALSGEEKKLLSMFGADGTGQPTYARLNQLRDEIGRALFKGQGPWADTSQANLAKYYAALADDQLAYVESVGGKELADKMKGSNTLFSQMFDTRRDMQATFGKQLEGSITPLLRRAVTGGSKGDAQDLNKLLARIPEDMQGSALLSSIMAQSKSSAAHGGFSFANYTKLYRGLRENGPVYSQIAKAIGPEGERILTDLYAISRRMADGETKVLKTGKGNQVLANAMQAESLVGGVLKATAKRGVTGASATAGAAVGGPAGAFAGASMAESTMAAISKAGKSRLEKAHDLLASSEFRGLVDKLSDGSDATTAVNRLSNSKAFNKFASAVGLGTPEARKAWLTRLLSATATSAPPSLSNPASPVVIEQ